MTLRCRFMLDLTFIFLVGITGCDGGGLDKVVVEGTVTYAGKPVANGEIQFHPAEGTVGPVSGAPIAAGRFRAEARGGVPVGTQVVTIEAYEASPGEDTEMTSGGRATVRRNYIPLKYNHESQLTIEVTGESHVLTHDFHLAK